jgi:hypothetical protein
MGMEDVLAAHTVHHYTWDYKEAGVNLASCECETLTVGRQDPSKLHAAHVAEALAAAGFGNLHDAWADAISRVEVIDYTGRAYTKYTPAGTVSIDRQDQGRTLKVFITEGATK